SQKVNRLPEHPGFGLNSAHAPANHAETVDHGRVRIRSDQRVWEKDLRFPIADFRSPRQDPFREVFQIHLMHDSDSRRNELERFKRLLPPLKKLVTLAVALELHLQIQLQRAR